MKGVPGRKRSLGAQALAVPAPVWVIGSYGADGAPNAMVASWGGICCSEPPCVAVSLRKSRLTHANLLHSRAFTVNVPSREHLAQTDFLGMVSGRQTDKFRATGLTPVGSAAVAAPMIKEFPLVLECRLLQSLDLGSHTQFIGEIVDVKADPAVLDGAGAPMAGKIAPLVASPGERAYYALGCYLMQAYAPGPLPAGGPCQPGRLAYGKPGPAAKASGRRGRSAEAAGSAGRDSAPARSGD